MKKNYTLRMSEEDHKKIKIKAIENNMTFSEYVLSVLLPGAEKEKVTVKYINE